MKADWFEMKDMRKRRIADAVWIPLRTVETITKVGEYGYPGYCQEFFGLGSLAVPLAKRDAAKSLGWDSIGTIHELGVWATKDFYKTAETYWLNPNQELGVELAMVQHFDGAEARVWHLNQDVVFALGLLREGDLWVRPSEGYVSVARLRHNVEGKPVALEIKNEFLRDYLSARSCFLRTTLYRSREAIVDNPTEAGSPIEMRENLNSERFELRVTRMIEGGAIAGTVAAYHVARTDVDPNIDVPVLGPETDENVEFESWKREFKGKSVFRVEGELWCNEDIEPAVHSHRVRHDPVPTGISFIVDALGAKLTSEELDDEDKPRWLWFKPFVILELLNQRGTEFKWYTEETAGVSCGPGSLTHFGINGAGLINVYAYDIAKLDSWQQRIWSGHNITPEGGVSKELLSAQMRAEPAGTEAPEAILEELFGKLNPLFESATGSPLFRLHSGTKELHASISRFKALEHNGIFALAKDIMRLIADRIDVGPLQKIAPPPPREKWGSLKSLEKYLATLIPPEHARKVMQPLFGVYELRLADAHLAASDLEISMKRTGIDPQASPLDKGHKLIDIVGQTIWTIGDIVYHSLSSRHQMSEVVRSSN